MPPTLTPCAGLGHLFCHSGPLPGGPNLCKGVTRGFSLPLLWSKGPVIVRGCWGRRRQGHHRESKGPQGHGDKAPIKLIQPSCWNFPPRSQLELGVLQHPWLWGPWVGGRALGCPIGGSKGAGHSGGTGERALCSLVTRWCRRLRSDSQARRATVMGIQPWGTPRGLSCSLGGGQDTTGCSSLWHWGHPCVLRAPRATALMCLGVPWHRAQGTLGYLALSHLSV